MAERGEEDLPTALCFRPDDCLTDGRSIPAGRLDQFRRPKGDVEFLACRSLYADCLRDNANRCFVCCQRPVIVGLRSDLA